MLGDSRVVREEIFERVGRAAHDCLAIGDHVSQSEGEGVLVALVSGARGDGRVYKKPPHMVCHRGDGCRWVQRGVTKNVSDLISRLSDAASSGRAIARL